MVHVNLTHKQGVALLHVMQFYMPTAKTQLQESLEACKDWEEGVLNAIDSYNDRLTLYNLAVELASRPRDNKPICTIEFTTDDPLVFNCERLKEHYQKDHVIDGDLMGGSDDE